MTTPPHLVPPSQASAATRRLQPQDTHKPSPTGVQAPAPAQPVQPAMAPHPTAGGPVAVLHDGAKLHFPPNTTPEGMDAGVQHHLSGRAQGATDAQASIQAATLQELQHQTALLMQMLRALQVMAGSTSQAIAQSTIAIVSAIKQANPGAGAPVAAPAATAPTVAQPAAWGTSQ